MAACLTRFVLTITPSRSKTTAPTLIVLELPDVCREPRAAFGASLSTYQSLRSMQADYYDRARFAHVFAVARRVPAGVEPALLALPGVVDVQASLSYDVLLSRDDVLEPMTARIHALPAQGEPRMNRLTLVAGRWPALRDALHHQGMSWADFEAAYRNELSANGLALEQLRQVVAAHPVVTLLFASKDLEHNNAVVLQQFLEH